MQTATTLNTSIMLFRQSGPQSTGTSPLLSADGTTPLTEKNAILERQVEHFNSEERMKGLPVAFCLQFNESSSHGSTYSAVLIRPLMVS